MKLREVGECTIAWCPGRLELMELFDFRMLQTRVVLRHIGVDGRGGPEVSMMMSGDGLPDEMVKHVIRELCEKLVDYHHSNTELFDQAVRARFGAGARLPSITGV